MVKPTEAEKRKAQEELDLAKAKKKRKPRIKHEMLTGLFIRTSGVLCI